jgi:hypothetical protein
LLEEGINAGKCFFCISLGFLNHAFPKGIESLQVWAEAYQGTTSSNPLFKFTVTDEVTTESLNMHPEDVMPFFPVQDTLLLDFQVFGDLPESDNESFGVNAMT